MGPITLPDVARKRRWGWLVLWTVLVFAGGVVAGPTLTGQALALVERAQSMLGMSTAKTVEKVKPVEPTPPHAPAAPSIVPLPSGVDDAPIGEERGAASTAAAGPVAPRAATPTGTEKSPGAAASPHVARAEAAAAEVPVARSAHTKSEAKTPSAKAAPTRNTASAQATGAFHDPFAEGAAPTNEPRPAAPSRKSKSSFEEPTPAEKSEPAPKPAASSSHDSLDNLMADVVTDTKGKGKGKQRDGKGLDDILKDVQKSKPEPPPKSEAPAAPPPLSQADISRVMAGVKTRGKECARQLGQKGIAELKLVVSKDGNVTDVKVGGKLAATPLGACIEKAARAASFPRSPGLRFDYGIDVR